MGAKDQSFKHVCETCGYSTNRISNFKDHVNRKKPCKPKEVDSTNEPGQCLVNVCKESVNVLDQPVNADGDLGQCSVNVNKYVCEICKKSFKSKQGKHQHKKNVNCKPPPTLEPDLKTDTERLLEEIDQLKSALIEKEGGGGQVINNYITNNHNSTTTNNNTTVINYNNFDSPSVSHITADMIGAMYIQSDRELPRMIGKAVRSIYKGLAENDTIKIKYGNQAGFAEVRQDDETRLLPVSDVLETVLSQTSTLCGKELQKCCGNDAGQIPGPNVVNHVNELSVLHWGFVPETHAQRQGYFKFVKSALM